MAIEIKAEQAEQPDTIKRRTFKVIIDSPSSGPAEIVVHRQIVPMKDGAQVTGGSEFHIARTLEKVTAEFVVLSSGVTVTAADIAEAIAQFSDKWDREDNHL